MYKNSDFSDQVSWQTNKSLYKNIIREFSFGEKIFHWFYRIFFKDKLSAFYKERGLKKIKRELAEHSWYNISGKELTSQFAENLYDFTRSLIILNSLLSRTVINPNIKKITDRQQPLMIELVFHCLRTSTSLKQYPFNKDKITEAMDGVLLPELTSTKENLLKTYFENLSHEEEEEVNKKYTELIAITHLANESLLDFLRRFNHAVDLSVENPPISFWTPVTLSAVESYVSSLYTAIDDLHPDSHDVSMLRALYYSYQELFPEDAFSVTIEDIDKNWQVFSDSLWFFQDKKTLYKLVCLAKKNPAINIISPKIDVVISDKFKEAVLTRVQKVANTIENGIYRKKMDELINLAVFNRIHHKLRMGFCNIDNNDRLYHMSGNTLAYVYTVTTIYHFMLDHVEVWFKKFLTLLAMNGDFVDFNDSEYVERCYRMISGFMSIFEKFVLETKETSTISRRMERFLFSKNKLTPSDMQILYVFTNSLNTQAEHLVSAFQELFPLLKNIIDKFIIDYENKDQQKYLKNIDSVVNMLNKEDLDRIHDLYIFCRYTKELMHMEVQRLKEDHE